MGCWRSFLLPPSSDPKLSSQAQRLCKTLSARGVTASEEMLKVCVVVFMSVLAFVSKAVGTAKKQPLPLLICVPGCAVCISFALARRP